MDGDQVQFVQEMRERMLDEYGTVPDYVFSNSQNGQETKIAWYINQCFTVVWGRSHSDEVQCHVNPKVLG